MFAGDNGEALRSRYSDRNIALRLPFSLFVSLVGRRHIGTYGPGFVSCVRVERRCISARAKPARQLSLPPEAVGAVQEVTNWAEALR